MEVLISIFYWAGCAVYAAIIGLFVAAAVETVVGRTPRLHRIDVPGTPEVKQ